MRIFILCFLFLLSTIAVAALPDEQLKDPVLEARAQTLSHHIRCPVCDGQSIASSDAKLAGDMRRLIRREMQAGKTDEEITEYLVSRYGDKVLFTPPIAPHTWLLWMFPTLVFVSGCAILFYRTRKG